MRLTNWQTHATIKRPGARPVTGAPAPGLSQHPSTRQEHAGIDSRSALPVCWDLSLSLSPCPAPPPLRQQQQWGAFVWPPDPQTGHVLWSRSAGDFPTHPPVQGGHWRRPEQRLCGDEQRRLPHFCRHAANKPENEHARTAHRYHQLRRAAWKVDFRLWGAGRVTINSVAVR